MTNTKSIKKDNILFLFSKNGEVRGYKDYLIEKYDFNQNHIVHIDSYPTMQTLEKLKTDLKDIKFDLILAIGGGSVMDAGKVLSVFLDDQLTYDLKRIIENPNKLDNSKKIELHVFPTTAGTGAEVTQFATIWDFENNKKYSLDHKFLLPENYFLDSQLLVTLKNQKLLNPLLDSISHAFESLWNKNRNHESIEYSLKSLRLNINTLKKINSQDVNHNLENMLLASNLAGKAINITRTSIAHSISYPLTAKYKIPHGLACSFTIPKILDFVKEDVIINENVSLLEEVSFLLNQLDLVKKVKSYLNEDGISIPYQEFVSKRSENFIYKTDKNLIRDFINLNS